MKAPTITCISELRAAGLTGKEVIKYREAERKEAVKHMRTAFGFKISKCVAEQALDKYLFAKRWMPTFNPMHVAMECALSFTADA